MQNFTQIIQDMNGCRVIQHAIKVQLQFIIFSKETIYFLFLLKSPPPFLSNPSPPPPISPKNAIFRNPSNSFDFFFKLLKIRFSKIFTL